MSDKCFLDTNILVYAHDRLAGAKHQRAATLTEQLWNEGTGLISTQVLQEFCYTVRRKLTHPLSLEDTFAVAQKISRVECGRQLTHPSAGGTTD